MSEFTRIKVHTAVKSKIESGPRIAYTAAVHGARLLSFCEFIRLPGKLLGRRVEQFIYTGSVVELRFLSPVYVGG